MVKTKKKSIKSKETKPDKASKAKSVLAQFCENVTAKNEFFD